MLVTGNPGGRGGIVGIPHSRWPQHYQQPAKGRHGALLLGKPQTFTLIFLISLNLVLVFPSLLILILIFKIFSC